MDPFTIELVSNASAKFFPDKTLSSCTNILTEQLNLEGQCEVAISEVSYPSTYQNVTERKSMFLEKKLSKSLKFYYVELDLYRSITDTVKSMNTLIHGRHNHSESYITVERSRVTQKFELYFANEEFGLAFFSTDLGHVFGSKFCNDFGVILRRKNLTNQKMFTTLSAYALS